MSARAGGSRPHPQVRDSDVRADWEQRIYRRLPGSDGPASPELPPPAELTATAGAGHIRLSWPPVPGAAGYVIERASADGDAPQILRHGGSDVPAVVGPPFADTGVADGTDYSYRVAAVAEPERIPRAWSAPVIGSTSASPAGVVRVGVDAAAVTGQLDRVWRMVGAERLSQLRLDGTAANEVIAAEFAAALRAARSDLGVRLVRAHAILHDDNAVVRRQADGRLRFDFSRVDAIYDQLLGLGLRPVVELSFMPAALAADPDQTVFTYRGIISPPADWAEWRTVVTELTAHLVDRYGLDEVTQWAFEVWNEPNLAVFWPGSQQDYLRLYAESAIAVKSVDARLLVGGPSTAAAEWIELLAEYATDSDLPLDFISTHTYGNLPPDFRPAAAPARPGRDSDLVDGVGRRLDPLRAGARQRHRRAVRAERLPERAGPGRRARLLGDQRPLRGTGPPAAPVPQRLRSAQRRQPAQAQVLGRAPGRAPRRRGAAHHARR